MFIRWALSIALHTFTYYFNRLLIEICNDITVWIYYFVYTKKICSSSFRSKTENIVIVNFVYLPLRKQAKIKSMVRFFLLNHTYCNSLLLRNADGVGPVLRFIGKHNLRIIFKFTHDGVWMGGISWKCLRLQGVAVGKAKTNSICEKVFIFERSNLVAFHT